MTSITSYDTGLLHEDILHTADLHEILTELIRRERRHNTCRNCEQEIEMYEWIAQVGYTHSDSGSRTCDETEEWDFAEPQEEMAEEELDLLECLRDLNKRLDGGLANARSLINDDYLDKYLQEQASELGVPDFIEPYVDWEGYANRVCKDLTEVNCHAAGLHFTYWY